MTAALATLPTSWLEGIAAGEYVERERATIGGYKGALRWIKGRPDAKGEPCKQVARVVTAALVSFSESGGGAHDELTDRVYELLSLAMEGHRGGYTAVFKVGRAFIRAVADDRRAAMLAGADAGTVRSREEAAREVERAVVGAVRLLKAHSEQPEMAGVGDTGCACWEEPKQKVRQTQKKLRVEKRGDVEVEVEETVEVWVEVESEAGSARDPLEYPFTDTGNAEQLIDLTNGNMLFVTDNKAWFGYDEETGIWRSKREDFGMQQARRIATRVAAAAEQRYRAAEGATTSVRGNRHEDPDKQHSQKSDAEVLLSQAGRLSKWAEKCGNAATLANMLTVTKSFDGMSLGLADFDAEPRLLHTPDGKVIELTELGARVREAKRSDRGSLTTAAPYVAGAYHPAWGGTDPETGQASSGGYLDTFLPDQELRRYVQMLFGYSLYGGNPAGRLVFLHGPTASGKSTCVEAVGAALGGYGTTFEMSLFRERQDGGPRPDIINVLDKRAIFTSEVSSAWHLHNDMIKSMVGGDVKMARSLFSNDFVKRVPQFVPFIATNAFPQIKGADAATKRRLIVLPFLRQVGVAGQMGIAKGASYAGERDSYAIERLRGHGVGKEDRIGIQSAVLNWLVEGWDLLCNAGGTKALDQMPEAVVKATAQLHGDVSDAHAWFYEQLVVTGNAEDMVPTPDFYERYRMHMLTGGVDQRDVMNARQLGMFLTAQGLQPALPKKIHGKKTTVRVGVKWVR